MRALGIAAALLAAGAIAVGQGVVGGDILFDLAGGGRGAGMAGAGLGLITPDSLFRNPAALPWAKGVQILSTYANLYGAARLGAVSVGLPNLAAAGIVLDAGEVSPGLSFRTVGAAVGAAVRLGPIGVGGRARLLRPVAPVPAVGGALDLALLVRGPLHVGAVWKGVLSRSPVPGELWSPELGVGLALPVEAGGWTLALACDLEDVGGTPSVVIGGELGVAWLLVRAGYGRGEIFVGGTVSWSLFSLDWALALHPVLAPALRVSFTVRL